MFPCKQNHKRSGNNFLKSNATIEQGKKKIVRRREMFNYKSEELKKKVFAPRSTSTQLKA